MSEALLDAADLWPWLLVAGAYVVCWYVAARGLLSYITAGGRLGVSDDDRTFAAACAILYAFIVPIGLPLYVLGRAAMVVLRPIALRILP